VRCIFVLGPQSSATRLWTEILIRSGCQGDFTHKQRLDKGLDGFTADKPIVWRRSYPHFKEIIWPDVREMVKLLPGYEFQTVVTTRDWWSMASSQVANRKGVHSYEDAYDRIKRAFANIKMQLQDLKLEPVTVSYEGLILNPPQVTSGLSQKLNISEADLTGLEIRNENLKWRNRR